MSHDTGHAALFAEWLNAHWPMVALAVGSVWGALVWAKTQVFKPYVTVAEMGQCEGRVCDRIDKASRDIMTVVINHIDKGGRPQ